MRSMQSAGGILGSQFWWVLDHVFLLVPAQTVVADFLGTFKDYPPRMKAASFSLDKVLEKMQQPANH